MKKLFVVLAVFTLALNCFAQSGPSTGLTDKDVKSFCKNYDKIQTELDKLGIDITDSESLMNVSESKETITKANKILKKNGISGSNPYDKVKAIGYGYAIEMYDSTVSKNQQAMTIIQKLGIDPMAEIKQNVSEDDCQVVKNNMDELSKAFNLNSDDINEVINDTTSASGTSNEVDYASLLQMFQSKE